MAFLDPDDVWLPGKLRYQVVARRRLLDKLAGFDPAILSIPDFDLWLRLTEIREPVHRITDTPLWRYRVHDLNAMSERQAITRDFWLSLKRSLDRIEARGSQVR